jgi:hypothetical protein
MNANTRPTRERAPEVQGSDLDSPNPSATGSPSAKYTAPRGDAMAEPVKVAEFWKNRRGESIRATLVCYEGRNCFDLRQHFTADDGELRPTKKGITIAVLRLPELVAAVSKALVRARELGLIEVEKTGGAA